MKKYTLSDYRDVKSAGYHVVDEFANAADIKRVSQPDDVVVVLTDKQSLDLGVEKYVLMSKHTAKADMPKQAAKAEPPKQPANAQATEEREAPPTSTISPTVFEDCPWETPKELKKDVSDAYQEIKHWYEKGNAANIKEIAGFLSNDRNRFTQWYAAIGRKPLSSSDRKAVTLLSDAFVVVDPIITKIVTMAARLVEQLEQQPPAAQQELPPQKTNAPQPQYNAEEMFPADDLALKRQESLQGKKDAVERKLDEATAVGGYITGRYVGNFKKMLEAYAVGGE